NYYSIDRVQTNLLVARTTGTSDTGALSYLAPDSNYLASFKVVIKDWFFSGGHATAPDSVKTDCLNWLVTQRTPAGTYDQLDSLVQGATWRWRISQGQPEVVFRECVNTLMNQPRTWLALQAQLVMDEVMTNYSSFRLLSVSNLAQGDFASDLF